MQKCTIVFHTSFQEIFITSGITVKVSDNLMRNGQSWKAFYFFPKEILNINFFLSKNSPPYTIITTYTFIKSHKQFPSDTIISSYTFINLLKNILPTLLFGPTLVFGTLE